MGVPKFYRWISERYPCLSETVKEYQIPEFDNLYLDMNGIIHNCSHPNDDDVHFRISEEKIFADIFHYLEVLFRLIKPQKVFFMAIDGVAPRAKMNQQRGRRFRSAKEAEDKEKEALRKGEVLPEEKRFDSNCITPGTEFMVNLQKQLEYFVKMKISSDPMWQKTQVILSGHQVPGEGEHKIMEFIRHQRSHPDYSAETRHCLYGLDADLMMLGLCSHEPYFSLLREEVKFGGSKKKNEKRVTTPEETTFHLLHLSLLREYLDLEFTPLKTKLKFPYDLERIIDDWVLMGFLVGNDFIPHLPHFHINKGALPLLYAAYMDVLPNLDGYLNENGTLNLARFEKFMERLAQIDYDHFNDIYADVKWLESRTGRKKLIENSEKEKKPVRNYDTQAFLLAKAAEIDELLGLDVEDGKQPVDGQTAVPPDELSELEDVDDEEDDGCDSVVSEDSDYDNQNPDEEEQFHAEFKLHKRHYYMDKLEYDDVDGSVLRDQAEGYIRAIQWILHYYYNGVCSWSWFYPHHYAPYVSDIKNFSNMELKFDLGKPFLPYEQLLGVLPAASQALLPAAHRGLMSSSDSPIIEFYPTKFQTDKNGKQQEWEAVVLIPFIDEKRLVNAMKDCEIKLTDEERRRNSHGPMQIYVWTEKDLGPYDAPAYFPTIPHNHCQCTELTRDAFEVPANKLVKGLHPRFNPDRYIPGFPLMRHLCYTGTLKKAQICVFQMNTLHESMILSLTEQTVPDIDVIGPSYCGHSIYVGWPHLVEARVVAVANRDTKYCLETDTNGEPVLANGKPVVHKIEMTSRDANEWRICENEIKTKYATRWGVEIGQTHVLVYATPVIGRKYIFTQSGRITLEKQWSPTSTPYALQATVKELQVKEIVGHQYAALNDVFPADSIVFMLGQPGYGLQGRVKLPVANKKENDQKGKVRVEFENVQEAISEELKKRWLSATSRYMPGYVIAQRLGISPHLVSRITGTVYLESSSAEQKNSDRGRKAKKLNVGLSLKYNKINQEVPGWSKKNENTWLYSHKTLEVLGQYIDEFPELFDFLSTNTGNEDYLAAHIFGPDEKERVAHLQQYIDSLPCTAAERQPCGTATIDLDTLKAIVTCGPPKKAKLKPLVMAVRPHLLYKPDLSMGSAPPDASTTYQLLDRVVNVRQGYSVPLGFRGTVVGVKNAKKSIEVVYEVLFDQEFQGGLPVRGLPEAPNRIYHLPAWAMINISHGKRQTMDRERPTAIVHPSGKAVLKQDTIKSQPKQNHASYKAATGNQTVAAKVAAQPKILIRTKTSNGTPQAAPAKQQTARAVMKTAPSPSSVPQPTPFMDIWNSLLKQQEQMQQKEAAEAQPTKQHALHKIQQKDTNQQSPKIPSLQEVAKILPKVPKPIKMPSEQAEAVPVAHPNIPTANPQIPPPTIPIALQEVVKILPKVPKPIKMPSEQAEAVPVAHPNIPTANPQIPLPTIPIAPSLPIIPGLAHAGMPPMAPLPMVQLPGMIPMVSLGTFHQQLRPAAFPVAPPQIPLSNVPLSVQQLFDLAGPTTRQPPATLKLYDLVQCKGLGVPFYSYSTLPDGTLVAEVLLNGSAVLGRAEGKTKEEASERAAALVLQHETFAQRMPAPGISLGQPYMYYSHPPAPTQPRVPTAVHRAPVPKSFVPIQVTRHSIQKQPRPQQATPSTPSKNTPHEASPAKQEPSTPSKVETAPPAPVQVQTSERLIAAKPPGSRLAIRFNGP